MVLGMSTPGWRTSLVVHGVDLATLAERDPRVVPDVPVVAGLLETAMGGVQLALRIRANGKPVILSLQAASQHIVHMRGLVLERLRLAGELIGGGQP